MTFRLEDASELEDWFYYAFDYNDSKTFPYNQNSGETPKWHSKDNITITTDKDTRHNVTIWTKFMDKLGNIMKEFIRTDPISFDTRRIDAEYYCYNCLNDSYGTLRQNYDVQVKINKNPFSSAGSGAQEGTLKIKYKWVPRGESKDKVDYKVLSFSGNQVTDGMLVDITPEGFQQEWLKKFGKSGSAFEGYYTCYARVELWAKLEGDTEQQISFVDLDAHEHYFDNKAPDVVFQKFSKTYAQTPVVAFDIEDDGGPASGRSNINMGPGNTYYTYVVKRIDASGNTYYVDISEKYPINTTHFSKTESNLGGKKTADGKVIGIDETEVYVKVTVQDEAGNRTEEISRNPVLIDINAPTVNELGLVIREGATSISYQNETRSYMVVNSFNDITGTLLNITDNTNATITINGEGGSRAVLEPVEGQSGIYSGTINLKESDFIFIEKGRGGAEHYCATLTVADQAGNTAYAYINVIVDNTPIYSKTPDSSLTSNDNAYTTDNVIARQYIYINDYETVEMLTAGLSLTDPNNKVIGKPVIVVGDNDNDSYIELILGENTVSKPEQPSDVYVTITDAFGNVSEKIYFIAGGIDKTPPTLTINTPSGNDRHEGAYSIIASDNEYLVGIEAALTEYGHVPDESDYFTSIWPLSTLITGVPKEYEENIGYAPSYAGLNILSEGTTSLKGSFEYRCLPTGNYTLYIRAKDMAGNVSEVYKHNFTASNEAPGKPQLDYYPRDTKTGGTVRVTVNTDQPVIIQKTPSNGEGSSIYYLQDIIRKFLLEGFTYRFNGETKTLSLLELELRRYHFWSLEPFSLKRDIEEEIIETYIGPKENYESEYEYYEAYEKAYEENKEIITVLIQTKYREEMRKLDIDEKTGKSIADEDFYLFGDIVEENWSEVEELKKIKELFAEFGIYILDGWDYYSDDPIAAITERVNSYYINTGQPVIDINESIFNIYLDSDIIGNNPELVDYATINFFRYPDDFDQVDQETWAAYEIQRLRREAVMALSAKYANMGNASVSQSFKTENVLIYRNNVDETLYAVNKYGQAVAFNVLIDNIDQSSAPSLMNSYVGLVYMEDYDYYYPLTDLTVKTDDVDKVRFVADADRNPNLYFYDIRLNGEPLVPVYSVSSYRTSYDTVDSEISGLTEVKVNGTVSDESAEVGTIENAEDGTISGEITDSEITDSETVSDDTLKGETGGNDISGENEISGNEGEHKNSEESGTSETVENKTMSGDTTEDETMSKDTAENEAESDGTTENETGYDYSATSDSDRDDIGDSKEGETEPGEETENEPVSDESDEKEENEPVSDETTGDETTTNDRIEKETGADDTIGNETENNNDISEDITVSESSYDGVTGSDTTYGIKQNPFFKENEEVIREDFPDFDNMTFYQLFEADLNGKNGIITFKYIDLSFAGQKDAGKSYVVESYYLVDVFDMEAPTGTIQYSMDLNSPTNKDIVATVVNVHDNRTGDGEIRIYYEDDPDKKQNNSFTFTDNGSKTFILEDYAGNKNYLTATVSNIDRTPPEITTEDVKFYSGGKEYDAVWDEDEEAFRYTGPYTNGTVTARLRNSETGAYTTYVFDHNETVSITISDVAGNETTVSLCVDRFDFTSPVADTANVRYFVEGTEFTGIATNKDVTVRFTVSDNIVPDTSYVSSYPFATEWIKVTGLNMRVSEVVLKDGVVNIEETVYRDTGLVTMKKLGDNLYEYALNFKYNGTAEIYLSDGAGNQAKVTVT